MGAGSSSAAAAAYARSKPDIDVALARLLDPDPTPSSDPTWCASIDASSSPPMNHHRLHVGTNKSVTSPPMHPSSRIPPTHNPHRLTPSPSPDTHPRRDTLLGFQAALTSAPAPEVDRVLANAFGDDGEIAPGTLDTLLERSCAALHKLKVTGSNPRGGGGGDDPDTWTRAINATTMCQHALSRANHGSTLPFLCGIQQDSNHSLIHSSSPDDASPATPKNSDGQKETKPKPAVYRFMAAVCQTLVSIDHEDEPSRYAVKVACVRCLQSIAAARVIAHTQSQSEGYHYPAGGVGINTRETTEGTGEGEDVDSFGLFDVLMDALDLASSEVITSDLYGKVSTELLRLWCTRPRRPAALRHVMHDPADDLGFLGRMSNLLLGDDTDDAEVTGSSPLGDESGALLVRLAYRPVSYDGVLEPGKARGVSITQRGEIDVDTLGTHSKRSSLERWGSGSGEVENVMRRASMDADEDPGTPTNTKSGGKDTSPAPFGSGFDSTVGGFAHGNGNGMETIPDTGVSIAANPFRDACFKSVTMSDEDEKCQTFRESFLERIVAAMDSHDGSVWAIRQRTIASVLLYTWVYGNEVFYRAFVNDQTQVRAVILALLKRLHDCNDGVDKEIDGTSSDSQCAMTTLLMLSQDSAVNTNIHGYVIASSSAVDWFRDGTGRKPMPGLKGTTLGSLFVLVLCRVVKGEMQRLTGNKKSFVCNCALACLANTAGELANVSSAASQRLIGCFDLLSRRYRKLRLKPGNKDAIKSYSANTGIEPAADASAVRDLAALSLAAISTALTGRHRVNPELVYAALQRKDEVFKPSFKADEDFKADDLVSNSNETETETETDRSMAQSAAAIESVLEAYSARIDEAQARTKKPGSHWSMDRVMDVIRAACEEDGLVGKSVESMGPAAGSIPVPPRRVFTYAESVDAHVFFGPVVETALS